MSSAGHDVLIVGAGPAGSALGARLARLGLRVMILEASRFPRSKPCGECLNPGAVAALERLGASDVLRCGAPYRGWHLYAAETARFSGAYGAGVDGVAISRSVLDGKLAELAASSGAEVAEGVLVTGLLAGPSGVEGVEVRKGGGRPLKLRASLVVGADGLRSVVRRRLSLLARPPRLRKLALVGHWRAPHAATADGCNVMFVADGAVVGAAYLGGSVWNVTVVIPWDWARRLSGNSERLYREITGRIAPLRPITARGELIACPAAVGPFDQPVSSAVSDGALLVGDAAGYYDPLTGQGIHRALRSAELAAPAVYVALDCPDRASQTLRRYDVALRREFATGYAVQRWVEAVISRPALFRSAVQVFNAVPALGNAVLRMVGDVNGRGERVIANG